MWELGRCLVLLALTSSACASDDADCNREGCDAMGSRAPMTGKSGVGGVVAEESDVVGNGCQQCPFASARIDFFASDGMGSDPPALPTNQPAVASIDANERYSVPLDPGSYVVCARSECVNVTVQANRVTTLNVRLIFGPTQFVIL